MRQFFGLFIAFYGLVPIYAATRIAPAMKYPHTPIEWLATELLVAGLAMVCGGFILGALRD